MGLTNRWGISKLPKRRIVFPVLVACRSGASSGRRGERQSRPDHGSIRYRTVVLTWGCSFSDWPLSNSGSGTLHPHHHQQTQVNDQPRTPSQKNNPPRTPDTFKDCSLLWDQVSFSGERLISAPRCGRLCPGFPITVYKWSAHPLKTAVPASWKQTLIGLKGYSE